LIELLTCPSCKAQSSSSARECSRCGRSFRSSTPLWPVALLVLILFGGGAGYFWSTGRLAAPGQTGAADGFGALTAKADAPILKNLESLAKDFRMPVETTRAVAWSWTSAIRRNNPKHERSAIIGAIVHSVRSHGVRGSLESYFEEYWSLAERGLDSKRIQPALRAQMYRGK